MDSSHNDSIAIITLSSDSEYEDEADDGQAGEAGSSSGSLLNPKQTHPTTMKSILSQIKIEDDSLSEEETSPQIETIENISKQRGSSVEDQHVQHQVEGGSSEQSQPPEPESLSNAFPLVGSESASMGIENRLASFIDSVETLMKEKTALENSEREARIRTEEATKQLATANEQISQLKEDLGSSQAKIHQQTDSISELKTTIEELKRQESGSNSKLKSVTATLMNLQAKMVQILEEAEAGGDSPPTLPSTSEQGASTSLASNSNSTTNILLSEVILKEKIENFEKDFESMFSQIEEQDQEILNELSNTNEMLNRIQASLMEQFGTESSSAVSVSSGAPQLVTLENMENQEMGDEQVNQILESSASTSKYSSVVEDGITKKMRR